MLCAGENGRPHPSTPPQPIRWFPGETCLLLKAHTDGVPPVALERGLGLLRDRGSCCLVSEEAANGQGHGEQAMQKGRAENPA